MSITVSQQSTDKMPTLTTAEIQKLEFAVSYLTTWISPRGKKEVVKRVHMVSYTEWCEFIAEQIEITKDLTQIYYEWIDEMCVQVVDYDSGDNWRALLIEEIGDMSEQIHGTLYAMLSYFDEENLMEW